MPAAEGADAGAAGGRRRRLAPAAVSAAALLCFFTLALLARPTALGGLDGRVNAFVAAHRTAALSTFFKGYTGLGQWLVLAAATAVVIAALAWRARRREAVFLLIVMCLAPLIDQALKQLFERARPPAEEAVISVGGYAFPSGHAMSSATFALAVAVIAWPTRWRWPAAGLAALFAFLMGASRIYLGVHWLTDVLAGWALAVALVTGVHWAVKRVDERRSRRAGRRHAMEPVEAVFLDWGNTLMVDDGSQSGPMATWPDVSVVDGAQDALRSLRPCYDRILVATNASYSDERDVGARKPDAVFYRAALLRAGRGGLPLAPARAVMVGDSWPNDMAGARAAGLRTVWFNPSRARRPHGAAAPDAEISALADLPQTLDALAGAAPVAPPRRAG